MYDSLTSPTSSSWTMDVHIVGRVGWVGVDDAFAATRPAAATRARVDFMVFRAFFGRNELELLESTSRHQSSRASSRRTIQVKVKVQD